MLVGLRHSTPAAVDVYFVRGMGDMYLLAERRFLLWYLLRWQRPCSRAERVASSSEWRVPFLLNRYGFADFSGNAVHLWGAFATVGGVHGRRVKDELCREQRGVRRTRRRAHSPPSGKNK